jgi:putative transposase
MFKSYKFRMYPNDKQKAFLAEQFGASRFIWNHFLDLRNKRYAETGKGMTYHEMSAILTEMKRSDEYSWLRTANAQSLQQTLMHLDTAFKRFFKHLADYPNFKRKRNRQSFQVPQHFSIEDNHLTIPKLNTPMRVFVHRCIEGEIQSLTVSVMPSGKYYVSILADTATEVAEAKPIKSETTVGVDVGLTYFLTLSDGTRISNPRNIRRSEKELTRRQKELSGKKRGSKNREKARIKVARVQEHVANQRTDFHNKLSDAMLRAYNTVITEDLNVRGMMGNHHMARSIADAGWSSFLAMLKAKASQRGKNIVEIGRFEPSSRMCSKCGNVKHDLKLSDRIYHCNACGLVIDRDLNAAMNILRMGLIKSGVPTDSGEFTPVDRGANTLSLLEKEGISQVHWLKQEAHVL